MLPVISAEKAEKDSTITPDTKHKQTKRSREREHALQALFACEISGEKSGDQLPRLIKSDWIKSSQFMEFLVSLYELHKEKTDEYIVGHLKNWDFERLALIDKIILRMAIIELIHIPDIPPEVSINEAIELAKKYSTDKSDKFINGILDAVFRKLKKDNRIVKSGRGLISKMQV